MAVQTSLIIQFNGPGGEASVQAEIDARPDGLNDGKTDFLAGDSVGFLVFLSGARIVSQTATAGAVIAAGAGVLQTTEILTFAKASSATTSKPIGRLTTHDWIGRDGGQVVATGGNTVRAVSGDVIGLASVSYQADYQAFRLQGVPTGIEQVLIVIEAEATL